MKGDCLSLWKFLQLLFGGSDFLFALAGVGKNKDGFGVPGVLLEDGESFFSRLGRLAYCLKTKREFSPRRDIFCGASSRTLSKNGMARNGLPCSNQIKPNC